MQAQVNESAVLASLETVVGRLTERIAEMVEALAWYANDDNYKGVTPDVLLDCGGTARWALHQSLLQGDT